MKLTIEIDNKSEMKKLTALFKVFKIDKVKIISHESSLVPVSKGNKKLDPASLFNIWADKPCTLEAIRKTAWQRK